MKIGKQEFLDAFDYSEYCCNYLDDFVRFCWDNKNWAKFKLEEDECFEDENGIIHTEIVSFRLNEIIDKACRMYYKIGLKYFGDDVDLDIKCTILTDE